MNIKELLEKKIERVTCKGFASDSYLKLDYAPDGTYSPWAHLVSVSGLQKLEVAPPKFLLDEAFGDLDDWEEYKGEVRWGF